MYEVNVFVMTNNFNFFDGGLVYVNYFSVLALTDWVYPQFQGLSAGGPLAAALAFGSFFLMVLRRTNKPSLSLDQIIPFAGEACAEVRLNCGKSITEVVASCPTIDAPKLSRFERGAQMRLGAVYEVAASLGVKAIDILRVAQSMYCESLKKQFADNDYALEVINRFDGRGG